MKCTAGGNRSKGCGTQFLAMREWVAGLKGDGGPEVQPCCRPAALARGRRLCRGARQVEPLHSAGGP